MSNCLISNFPISFLKIGNVETFAQSASLWFVLINAFFSLALYMLASSAFHARYSFEIKSNLTRIEYLIDQFSREILPLDLIQSMERQQLEKIMLSYLKNSKWSVDNKKRE